MADAVLIVLLLLAVTAAVLLARRALRHWYAERAGKAYELPVDHRSTALWAAAAGTAAVVAASLAVPLLRTPTSPAAAPVAARSTPSVAYLGEPDFPPPPLRTPQPAPPPPEVRTVGHPAGGTLQVLRDGTRVWMPSSYSSPRAAGVAFPVVLAHVDGPQGDPDLYAGFAAAVSSGRADQFLVVMPDSCGRDSDVVLAETAQRYRTLTAVTARAVLGIGAQAPCAVREALTHPGRYAAGVGVSGSYPPPAGTTDPHPPLLLAAASAESGPRASALRLRDALRPHGDAVRVLDVGDRREVMSAVAGYLTEKLDAPTRPAPAAPAVTGPVAGPTAAAGPGASAAVTRPAGSAGSKGSKPSAPASPPRAPSAPHAGVPHAPVPPQRPHRSVPAPTHRPALPHPSASRKSAPPHPPASPHPLGSPRQPATGHPHSHPHPTLTPHPPAAALRQAAPNATSAPSAHSAPHAQSTPPSGPEHP